jgi:hypothetical protein
VEEDPMNAAISAIVDPHRGDTPGERHSPWRDAFGRTKDFGPLDVTVFESVQEADADTLEARVASISFIAALDAAERAPLLERARALAGSGTVAIPYRTEVYTCRRL